MTERPTVYVMPAKKIDLKVLARAQPGDVVPLRPDSDAMTDLDAYLTSHTPAQIMERRAKAMAELAGKQRQAIIARYAQGKSMQAVAAEFGVTAATVSRFVIAAGAPRRPRGRPKLFGVVQARAHENDAIPDRSGVVTKPYCNGKD